VRRARISDEAGGLVEISFDAAMAGVLLVIAAICVGAVILVLWPRRQPESYSEEAVFEPPLGNVHVIEPEPEISGPMNWKDWDKRNPKWRDWL
jgi:hypothetical protein